jgi:hypothetical protein
MQTASYEAGSPDFFLEDFADSQIYALAVPPTIIQASPQSTKCTQSTTSSVGYSFGGRAGWSQTQGLNAALTGGIDISNSVTFSCPQISILYAPNLSQGFLYWQYDYGEGNGEQPHLSINGFGRCHFPATVKAKKK